MKQLGCIFHFGQAMDRKAKSRGLHLIWDLDEDIYRWFRRALALSMVPTSAVRAVWNTCLLPFAHNYPDVELRAVLMRFVGYFNTWLDQVGEWNHFDNSDHRSSNPAESLFSMWKFTGATIHPALEQ